jgi:hypothetical protein
MATPPDPLAPKIAIGALSKAWGWKPGRLYRLCALRKIPHVRIAGQIFFEPAALEVWLTAQRHAVQVEPGDVVEQVRVMTREAECHALKIPVDHPFS